MSSPLPTAAQWPEISRLLDEVLALAAADRAPWLEKLATADPVHHSALRELLVTLERVEEDDFMRELPRLDVGLKPANILVTRDGWRRVPRSCAWVRRACRTRRSPSFLAPGECRSSAGAGATWRRAVRH